jgi:hypothetical protein
MSSLPTAKEIAELRLKARDHESVEALGKPNRSTASLIELVPTKISDRGDMQQAFAVVRARSRTWRKHCLRSRPA